MHHRFAPHELLELHELLSHETVCAHKGSILGQSLADNDVRNFAQKCMSLRQKRIQDCQSIIGHSGSEATGGWGVGQTWGNTASQGYEVSRHTGDTGERSYESGSYGSSHYDFGKKH